MSKKSIISWTVLMLTIFGFPIYLQAAESEDHVSVKAIVNKYHQTSDDKQRIETAIKLSKTKPTTQEDVSQLRSIFQKKEWDENLYAAGIEAVKKIRDASLDNTLVDILKDEKPLMEKFSQKDYAGKSEREVNHRAMNVMFIMMKLGELKSENAVPVLKEYLKINGPQYWASEALAKIGDKSASEEIREKAYKGDEVNYGGLGLDEASRVIRDLEDKNQKDNWPTIAKQLLKIKGPEAKRQLPRLFNHEKKYVREKSSMAYSNMVDNNDKEDIIKMAMNQDWIVRSFAIDSMKRLSSISFNDVLINILLNDPHKSPRSDAAQALGYKKLINAVPFLEKALRDKDLYVRQEAFIALYALTKKMYPFEGRDRIIEQKAEQEKAGMKFYR